MITMRDWYLSRYDDLILGYGLVSNHPRHKTGELIHTSSVTEAVVENGKLCLTTVSGSLYVLQPEWFELWRREETAACLAELGIGGDFAERCVRAREEADARRRAEAEAALKPGELLLEVMGYRMPSALYRTAEGEVRTITPTIHGSMFQDSVLITDWEGGTVDFRYFPHRDWLEPYHISDGLNTIKIRNLGSADVLFGREGKKVACKADAITAIPAAEHDDEWLFSPDAVNGKGLCQGLLDGKEKRDGPTIL